MSESLRIASSPLKPINQSTKPTSNSPSFLHISHQFPNSTIKRPYLGLNLLCSGPIRALKNLSEEEEVGGLDSLPISLELEEVSSETQFDRILDEAQQLGQPLIVLWKASWCRKCIYLKPKLEKLAAEYYHKVQFYCVDVNAVPHKFVVRAEVTKMPTIQLWKDSKKQAEVIGGHNKAYQVMNDVREMIDNELLG